MSPLRLTNLDSALQEPIITKFDAKSYFRLQRACRSLYNLIRKSRNISVFYNRELCPSFKEKRRGKWEDILGLRREFGEDLEDLYGIRLGKFLARYVEENCEELLEQLTKYRITAEKVYVNNSHMTKEECAALLDILKPVSVFMNRGAADRLEAVLNIPTLKNGWVSLEQNTVTLAAERLLSSFSSLEIYVTGCTPFSLLTTVLNFFFSNSFSNLRTFKFTAFEWQKNDFPTSTDKLAVHLPVFNVDWRATNDSGKLSCATVILPGHLHQGASCEFKISTGHCLQLEYHRMSSDTNN